MKKAGRYLLVVLPVLIGLGIQALCGALAGFVYGFVYSFRAAMNGETASPAEIQAGILAGYSEIIIYVLIASQIVSLLVFGIWYRMQNKKTVKRKVTQIIHGKTIGWIMLFGIGLQALTSVALQLAYLVVPDAIENTSELLERAGIGELGLFSMAATVIMAPIVEEITFRGVTMKLAKKAGAPFLAANLLQAFLFGVYHANPVQGVYAFILGLVLGMAAQKYGSLYPSVLLHLVFNLSATLLNAVSGLFPAAVFVPVLFAAVGAAFIGIGVQLFKADEKEEASETADIFTYTEEESKIQQGEKL